MLVWRNSKCLNITLAATYSNHWDWDSKDRHVTCGRRRTDPTWTASLLQGRRLRDYRAGDSLYCRLYVKQSAVLSVSFRHTNTQTHMQPFISGSESKWTLKNVTTVSRGKNPEWGSVNSKCQHGQNFSFRIWTEFHFFGVRWQIYFHSHNFVPLFRVRYIGLEKLILFSDNRASLIFDIFYIPYFPAHKTHFFPPKNVT